MEVSQRDNAELTRLWRVFRTTRQMCADRGYELLEEDINISLDDFRDRYARPDGTPDRGKLAFSARPTDEMLRKYTDIPTAKNPDPQPSCGMVWVEFNGSDNIGVKELRQYMHHLNDAKMYLGIYITKESITVAGKKFLLGDHEFKPPGGVQIFEEQDLLVNITKHELVPKHILLSKEEKVALLERYRLKETQLPRIQQSDPMARYLGLSRGQVVKIIRKSETAGRYASYRWVL